jgi:hypothetical protein
MNLFSKSNFNRKTSERTTSVIKTQSLTSGNEEVWGLSLSESFSESSFYGIIRQDLVPGTQELNSVRAQELFPLLKSSTV